MFTLSRARTWCALVLSLSLSGLSHAAFTQLISFGDSLSDRGNIFTATGFANPTAPYVAGQFSNGTVWTGLLAAQLGVSSSPSNVLGGTNYAYGGARTTTTGEIFPGSPLPSTAEQVNNYLTTDGATAPTADSNALYTLWTGGNDINAQIPALLGEFFAFGSISGASIDAAKAVLEVEAAAVADIAQELISAGAQDVLVNNLPNLGLVPGVTGSAFIPLVDLVGIATELTGAFNAALANALSFVTGGNIIAIDAFALTNDIVANPGDYGLTNATDRCLAADDVTPCANPEDYLFWDDLHPTAKGHMLIADAAYAAVIPVPAALPLMLSALMGLGVIKRARKA